MKVWRTGITNHNFSMDEAIFKCVFVSRNTMTSYTVKTCENKIIDVVYFGKHVPILHSILYDVHLAKYLTILDGERLWNRHVHGLYFPLAEFRETWDAKFYIGNQKTKSKQCVAWLRFDLDFHIQRLIPHIPAIKYVALVRKGQEGLEDLVYKVGGVCPLALSRAGASQELVRDAANLKRVVDATKRLRSSPWLGQADCASFMVEDPETHASFKRLASRGAIVKRSVGGGEDMIALAWAAKFDDTKARGGVGKYVKFLEPKADKDALLEGDPSFRMDRCIDHRTLPCTMWSKVVWEDGEDTQDVKFVNAVGRQMAIEIIKDELQQVSKINCSMTYIVFSSQGHIGIDRPGCWTCCNKQGRIRKVQISVKNSGTLLVDGIETLKEAVFDEWECCDRRRLQDIPYLDLSTGIDFIAAIFATRADREWASRICASTAAKKVFIQLAKKE